MRDHTLGIVILAAGQGVRMRSALPKVLHSLAGKPLIEHVIDTGLLLNPQIITVVHGHGGEQVMAHFADNPNTALLNIKWVEQTKRLGTAHAVQQAMPSLQNVDKVLVLYGDVPLISINTLQQLLTATTTPKSFGLITAKLPNPTGYGRIIREAHTGRILRIVEQKDANTDELAINESNTGIMMADRSQLYNWLQRIDNKNSQGEFYLTDCIALAVADGIDIVSVQPEITEEILGVNNRSQLSHLERHFQRHQAETLMQMGVTLMDPNRFDLRGNLYAAQDVTIDINVIIEGNVNLETGVNVGPNCILRNCHIGQNTVIHANSVIEDAKIGREVHIGPFARIRPGTELAAQVHIGNFVELKNTKVGTGSKANHLTYLGDSKIGSGVNIGAGTITCNYDGANKHQTIIGDNAFIGSNAALVAPVNIGTDATIGAGSVVTNNAPDAQLTVARAPQRTLVGWERPKKKL